MIKESPLEDMECQIDVALEQVRVPLFSPIISKQKIKQLGYKDALEQVEVPLFSPIIPRKNMMIDRPKETRIMRGAKPNSK